MTPIGTGRKREDVRIHIWITEGEPLAGHATAQGRATMAFEGWLEMLQVLAELVSSFSAHGRLPIGGHPALTDQRLQGGGGMR